jgi:hypothetical protein
MVRIKGVQMWHGQSAWIAVIAFVDADLVSEVQGHRRCSTCKAMLAKPVPVLVDQFRATVLPSHLHKLHVAIMTVSIQHSKNIEQAPEVTHLPLQPSRRQNWVGNILDARWLQGRVCRHTQQADA